MREAHRKWRRKIWAVIDEARNCPCQDCGQSFPRAVMQLHHRDPEEKSFTINRWLSNKSPEGKTREQMVRDEIEKCDVLCANCHLIRHNGNGWERVIEGA